MLLLVFQAGAARFGLDITPVLEVLPVPTLNALPRAPEWVAGVFSYRGAATPVVDLSSLLAGRPSRPVLSTRVILVKYPAADGTAHLLGLLAEQVVETVSCALGDLQPSGVRPDDAPYLGDLLPDGSGFVQTVTVNRLLPGPVRRTLFSRED